MADHGAQAPDLYRLLGVAREASREEIALAWRRLARAEHPDVRPADVGAADRFRALADAWRVLGDPGLRAAYDRSLAPGRPAAAPAAPVRIPVRYLGGPEARTPQAGPAAPLRAGPVRVERPRQAPGAGSLSEEDIRLAALAELTLRYLGRRW